MSKSFQIGDVIQLKCPPAGGELSCIDEKLFAKVAEYFDFIHDTSYTAEPSLSTDRQLLVIEVFSGTTGYRVRGFPLSEKNKNSKVGFLENVISVKRSEGAASAEYVAVPISVNATKEDWIDCKVTQIPIELASEIGIKKYTFVIGKDPRDH